MAGERGAAGRADPAVALRGVEVVEGGARILGPLDWAVAPSEHWVVLGPNGAGKSTLLRVAGGWRLPTRGAVDLLGARIGRTDVRDLRARVGWVAAELSRRLAGGASVAEVVATGRWGALRLWRQTVTPALADRVDDLLARVGCARFGGRSFATLSDGERQRVLLARALVADPELVLLDEPFAGLDLAGRELLVTALAGLAADEAAPPAVLVTHHAEDIPPGFGHALLLREGRAVAAGPAGEVLRAEPLSACFALPLEVERRHGRWATRVAPG